MVLLTRRREVWRTAFTLSVICAALAITLWVFRSQIDAWLGVWNVANLASHCVWVIGNGLTLISLEGMKQAQLSRRLVRVHLGAAGVAVAMMIICWWRAPIHSQFHEDLAPLADSLALTLYYGIFYGFMGWCLARAAWFCLGSRRAFRRADPARGASLLIIGFASIGGLVVIGLYFASILARFLRGREAPELTRLGNVILPWPFLGLAVGVLSLVVVPWVISAADTFAHWSALRPLWIDLTRRCPQVHLNPAGSGGPLERLRMREERMIIEIHDALRLIKVDVGDDESIRGLAIALHRAAGGERYAADILPTASTRDADVAQLVELSRAYEEVLRRGQETPANRTSA